MRSGAPGRSGRPGLSRGPARFPSGGPPVGTACTGYAEALAPIVPELPEGPGGKWRATNHAEGHRRRTPLHRGSHRHRGHAALPGPGQAVRRRVEQCARPPLNAQDWTHRIVPRPGRAGARSCASSGEPFSSPRLARRLVRGRMPVGVRARVAWRVPARGRPRPARVVRPDGPPGPAPGCRERPRPPASAGPACPPVRGRAAGSPGIGGAFRPAVGHELPSVLPRCDRGMGDAPWWVPAAGRSSPRLR